MHFKKWLETVAAEKSPKLGIGNGSGWDTPDDDDSDNDDYENGPWGWNKMESINLKLHEWAKTSPAIKSIGQIFTKYIFGQPPAKENVRVFPNHVQVEVEWEFNLEKWSELDNEIEGVLKKSDLYKPLGTTPDKLWTVVDSGAVYDYMLYVIILALTGRREGTSYLDKQTSFFAWEYIRTNWTQKEQVIKAHINDFHEENNLGQVQIQLTPTGRGFNKPMGLCQYYKDNMWAKGVIQIPYQVIGKRGDDPDVWNNWGEERPINQIPF